MKKIALLTTVLFASTAVFAGTIANNSGKDETLKVELNGKKSDLTIKAGQTASVDDAASVSYKGKTQKANQNLEINSKKELAPAPQKGAAAAPAAGSPAAATNAAAQPSQQQPTPASAQQQQNKAAAPQTSNQ